MNSLTLNPLDVPLQGVNLIEASAGTGKTWNIAALFTRLVVLERKNVNQILVVTFTKAATAELKTRLRARLDDTLRVLEQHENLAELNDEEYLAACGGDIFISKLLQRALAQEELPRLKLRVQAAVSDFDRAGIYTIHGFCQRILTDFAFYCGAPFQIEQDMAAAEQEQNQAAADFWRTHVAADADFAQAAFKKGWTPQAVWQSLKAYAGRPYLRTQPVSLTGLSVLREMAEGLWRQLAARLPEIEAVFWRVHPNLNGNAFREAVYRQKFVDFRQRENAAFDGEALLPLLLNSSEISVFDPAYLRDKIKKGKQIADEDIGALASLDELSQACRALQAAEQQLETALSLGLLDYVRAQMLAYKKSGQVRTYDDLIADVSAALQPDAPHAQALAQAIAETWQVALIDEFQDTDPLQYAIFQAAFADTGTPLFLVGDPKQAIYAFRGADIFAYLDAARSVGGENAGQRYTIATNFRSRRPLVNSISRLFSRENPFVLPDIGYHKIDAAREQSRLPETETAFCVRWLHEENESCKVDDLRDRAADYCARDIAGKLNRAAQGEYDYAGKPLCAGDIAVLVRTGAEGVLMQQALKARGVQSVMTRRESVFASEEAEFLQTLLAFVLRPQANIGLLRFMLAGTMFGWTAQRLQQLNDSEQELQTWLEQARYTLEIWQSSGIYAAVQHFVGVNGIEMRLLRNGNERALTNLYQLMEFLAQEDEQSRVPAALLQWLQNKIQTATGGEDAELRLESDENLVRIVTIHASKGLQYPIVFCPFIWRWGDQSSKEKWRIVHQNGEAWLLHAGQITPEQAQQADLESLSEQLRLLYVALTRAQDQVNVYMGKPERDSLADHPIAHLLQLSGKIDTAQFLQAWQEWIEQAANEGEQGGEWALQLADAGLPESDVCYRAADEENGVFQAASFAPRRFAWIQQTSFTGLSRQNAQHAEAAEELVPTLDAAEQSALPEVAAKTDDADGNSIHRFPCGAAAGVCLHAVLEHYQFEQSPAGQQEYIAAQLTRHGYDAGRWLPAVMEMAERTARAPLTAGMSLGGLNAAQRLPEMGFLLHTEAFNVQKLRTWFAQPHLKLPEIMVQAAQRLGFAEVNGFINGFIDMLCCDDAGNVAVIDYKSNYLGADASAYTAQAVNEAVAHHHYYLQALIYAVAVARYLQSRNRLPETVSVRYLFVRGLDEAQPQQGVWAWDIATADLAQWL